MNIGYNSLRRKESGFTLIELAIVMIIVGIVIAGALPAYRMFMEGKKTETLAERQKTIRAALADYIIDDEFEPDDPSDVRYPCPASPTIPFGQTGFGQEDCSLRDADAAVGTCSGGICVRAGSTPGTRVLVGAVPTTTLEIGGQQMLDAYSNQFTYAVSFDLTRNDSMRTMGARGNITILNEAGDTVTDAAQFALISHGADQRGSYTASGVQGTPCRTTGGGDSENCDDDAVFHESLLVKAALDSAYDDSLVFSLAEEADQWWMETSPGSGNITNRNVGGSVSIGPRPASLAEPSEQLEVVGNMISRGGSVIAEVNVQAASNVTAGNNATVNRDLTVGLNATVGNNASISRDVTVGNNATVNKDIRVKNNATIEKDVNAYQDIYANRNMFSTHFYYSTTPSSKGSSKPAPLPSISCPDGQVLKGIDGSKPVCVPMATLKVPDFACPDGQNITGIKDGAIVCSPLAITVHPEQTCNFTAAEFKVSTFKRKDRTCDLGTHAACFLTKISGREGDDLNGFACGLSGTVNGPWSMKAEGWDIDDVFCSAVCVN